MSTSSLRYTPVNSCNCAGVARRTARGCGGLLLACLRQHDLELGEEFGLRIDVDAAAVLFHDDVVADRQARPGTFARGLGREERVEYLLLDLFRGASPVVANTDFDPVSEVLSFSHWSCWTNDSK